jgi:hypothetical protein
VLVSGESDHCPWPKAVLHRGHQPLGVASNYEELLCVTVKARDAAILGATGALRASNGRLVSTGYMSQSIEPVLMVKKLQFFYTSLIRTLKSRSNLYAVRQRPPPGSPSKR